MEYVRITLRLPTDLHRELIQASESKSTSMNAEIIARLRSPSEPLYPSEARLREIVREELANTPK